MAQRTAPPFQDDEGSLLSSDLPDVDGAAADMLPQTREPGSAAAGVGNATSVMTFRSHGNQLCSHIHVDHIKCVTKKLYYVLAVVDD